MTTMGTMMRTTTTTRTRRPIPTRMAAATTIPTRMAAATTARPILRAHRRLLRRRRRRHLRRRRRHLRRHRRSRRRCPRRKPHDLRPHRRHLRRRLFRRPFPRSVTESRPIVFHPYFFGGCLAATNRALRVNQLIKGPHKHKPHASKGEAASQHHLRRQHK